MMVANNARRPITHFQLWMQKHHSDHSYKKLTDFVCIFSRQIASEWDGLLFREVDGQGNRCWEDLLALCTDEATEAKYRELAALHCLLLRCEYNRRIEAEVNGFPMLIMWLVWKAPDTVCNFRKECARDILEYSLLPVVVKVKCRLMI